MRLTIICCIIRLLTFSSILSKEYISVEYNKLSGEIPEELGSLEWLSSLLLQDNAFNGTIPEEVCAIRKIEVSADCDEVDCNCCRDCCYGCTRDPITTATTTAAPTDAATEAAVVTTSAPSTEAPTAPTSPPSAAGNLPCSSIQLETACYNPGQEIGLIVDSCDVDEFDLIVMFEEGSDITSFRDAVFWVRSCGLERCNGVFKDGFLLMENRDPERLGFARWPFDIGAYRLYLLRVLDTGVVETLALSSSFRIDETC
jgi:hypothetical protein